MGQLVGCIRGIAEACKALDFPVVSGNVSLYNETNGRAILPTPTIGGVGVLDDFTKSATLAFKAAGEAILLVGETRAGSASRSICATSAAARRARRRRSISPPSARNGDFVRGLIARRHRDRRARCLRRRASGRARRDGDGVRHRRRARRCARDFRAHAFWFGEDQARYVRHRAAASRRCSSPSAPMPPACRLQAARVDRRRRHCACRRAPDCVAQLDESVRGLAAGLYGRRRPSNRFLRRAAANAPEHVRRQARRVLRPGRRTMRPPPRRNAGADACADRRRRRRARVASS